MGRHNLRIALIAGILALAQYGHAQSTGSGSNAILIGIIAIAVFVVLVVIIQVADNLLVLEAKQRGVDKNGANLSLFPRLSEIIPSRRPDYVNGDAVKTLTRGHDILLSGKAEGWNKGAQAATFAVQPANFNGLSSAIPKLEVEEKQTVKAGDVLFYDKKHPEIKYVAPVSGEVIAINRGEKRAIAEVVILADREMQYRDLPAMDLESASREELVAFLMEYGGWPLIRRRPFNVIATPDEVPVNIFISTFDTAPLAADQNLVVEGRGAAFQKGIEALARMTSGKVYLGMDARGDNPPSEVFTGAQLCEKVWFKGKHPAGNVGVQIHHIAPINPADRVWTLGVQEVITLGHMFLDRRYRAERVVAVAGAELQSPAYVRTYIGANVGDLVKGNLKEGKQRILSGDVLTGARKSESQFLDFYDDQITVLQEGDYFEMFGWLLPIKPRPSISRTFPNFLLPGQEFRADTNTHGEKRAFVVTGQYEEVLPMDVYPQHLMKAILVGDYEQMEGLGIYELVEEDVALCEFVCTSKQPLQEILREGLDMMNEQS